MTLQELRNELNKLEVGGTKIANKYRLFKKTMATPYIIFFEVEEGHFFADGEMYHTETDLEIKYYDKEKNLDIEEAISSKLRELGLNYNKQEDYSEKEEVVEITYSFSI